MADDIAISIVSHEQAALVAQLLDDLRRHKPSGVEVLLTLNTAEAPSFDFASFPFRVTVIRNAAPKGFGENHNAAFARAQAAFFCVLNPDIRLSADPFPALVAEMRDAAVGAVAPLMLGPGDAVEDSARPFPTLAGLIRKALGLQPRRYYAVGETSISPDWLAGMFLLLKRDAFAKVGGFDPGYHLYYEDVDLCTRLRLAGYDVRLVPKAQAIHHARRRSRGNVRYAYWHLRSMARYLLSDSRRRLRQGPAR